MAEPTIKEVLGQIVDLSYKNFPQKGSRYGLNLREWRCLFCGEAAQTPPQVKHREGCVIAKANKHLRGEE